MSLRDCLNSAVEQGAINRRQADELFAYFDARFRRKRAQMSEREAAQAALREVSEELRMQARERKRQALLTEAKRKELTGYFAGFRNVWGNRNLSDAALSKLVHYGFKGTESVQSRFLGIMSLAQRDLSAAMSAFRRSAVLGRRQGKADLPDVIRELNGEATGNATAKALARAFAAVREDLRVRFNKAGGNIPKREGFDLTHTHDARAIMTLGRTPQERREQWKAFIRPLLDPERMTNPATGETVGREGLDAALDHVFDSIVSDNRAHLKPSGRRFGKGALANRYQDARFLEFRNADAWLAYNERFGQRDPVAALFGQIKTLARDIAAMEILGPNPDAMIEWMKQGIAHEEGKALAGRASILDRVPRQGRADVAAYRLDALWRQMRGRETVWHGPARFAADIRNVASSAMLQGTSILAAATDPFIAAQARLLAGLPVTAEAHRVVKAMASNADRDQASRAAILWDDYLHVMNEEVRFADHLFGHEWSQYLVDRALTWNGLKPLTEARKRIEATAWHETLGGYAAKDADWLDLPDRLKTVLEGFAIGAEDWHRMRRGVDPEGFLSPAGIADAGMRPLAEKYAGMIAMWSERSVPTGDTRIRSTLTGALPRGTVGGELLDFGMQFLSFGLSYTARQIEAAYIIGMRGNTRFGRTLRGAGYVAASGVSLAIGAAMAMQIQNVVAGRDPQDMTRPSFWTRAYVKGGGGGLFADFLERSESRFGGSLAETIPGPASALVSDMLDLTGGSLLRWLRGDEQKLGRRVTAALGRYVPVVNHPATRAAYQRLVVDQLQWLLDPDADRSFKAKKRRAAHWWEPGETAPRRPPDPGAANLGLLGVEGR